MTENRNYIGITGCTEVYDLIRTRSYYFAKFLEEDIVLMVGFLVSHKFLKTETPYPHNNRYVSISRLFELLKISSEWDLFKTIHYNTRRKDFFKEISILLNSENQAGERLLELIDGIQLNISNPSPNEILKIKQEYPHLSIILQLNNSFQKSLSTKEMARKIKFEYPFIDYVLVDASGGKGKQLDVDKCIAFFNKMKRIDPKLNIGFAGGLSGDILFSILSQIKDKTNSINFSIDAGGKLRDSDDILNLNKIETYLGEYSRFLYENKQPKKIEE